MKYSKNKRILLVLLLLLTLLSSGLVSAVYVDHTFTYQGQLMDDGNPANGDYDIIIQGYTTSTTNSPWGNASTHMVNVVNGVFTIEHVDLGANAFDGIDLYLGIQVRLTGGSPAYETLTPRQKMTAAPYASKLINGSASNGQVYTFDGDQWLAADNDHVNYVAGVGISIEATTINNTISSMVDLSDVKLEGGTGSMGIVSTMPNNTGAYNMVVGKDILGASTNAARNTVLGHSALRLNIAGDENVAIGFEALNKNISSQNTSVGTSSGFFSTGEGNVFLGFRAGYHETRDNKLYIENSDSLSPLIGGDFSTDEVVINGQLGIGTDSPQATLHVVGDVKIQDRLVGSRSGDADMKAYLYGAITEDGILDPGRSSDGFSISKTSTGVYRINFNISLGTDYVVVANSVINTAPRIVTLHRSPDWVQLHIWDLAGNNVDAKSNFVIFRK